MADKFTQQIDEFVKKSKDKQLAVIRQSLSDIIDNAQTTVAKGGKMRVLTGFLRASGAASLNAPPKGAIRGDRKKTFIWDGESINIVLAKLKIGDTFFFGWTARYAKHREVNDGFLASALLKWKKIVGANIRKLKD